MKGVKFTQIELEISYSNKANSFETMTSNNVVDFLFYNSYLFPYTGKSRVLPIIKNYQFYVNFAIFKKYLCGT